MTASLQPGERVPLDELDRQLLVEVQSDARRPQAAIGAAVGLSAPAVNRRLNRLYDAGVIQSQVAVVRPERVGPFVTVVAHVAAVSEEPDRLDALRAAFVAHRLIQQCYYVTGEWDFVLVVVAADMNEYTALTRELFFAGNNVHRFSSMVVMDRAKVGLAIPVS